MTYDLLQYLGQSNPYVNIKDKKPRRGKATTNPDYPIPKDIRYKSWFNLDTISTIFEGSIAAALRQSAADLAEPSVPSLDGNRPISHEETLTKVLDASIIPRIRYALRHPASQGLLSHRTDIVSGIDTIMFFTEDRMFRQDYAGTRDSQIQARTLDGTDREYCLLPGEVKLSWKCDSESIRRVLRQNGESDDNRADAPAGDSVTLQHVDPNIGSVQEPDDEATDEAEADYRTELESIWPFRQLLQYCLGSYARYGWILTDKEVFLVRIDPHLDHVDPPRSQEGIRRWYEDRAIMEFFVVPWKHLPHHLSICLSLWFLHIIAANNGNLSPGQNVALHQEQRIDRRNQVRLQRPRRKKGLPPQITRNRDHPYICDTTSWPERTPRITRSATNSFQGSDALVSSFDSESSDLGRKRKRGIESEAATDNASILTGDLARRRGLQYRYFSRRSSRTTLHEQPRSIPDHSRHPS